MEGSDVSGTEAARILFQIDQTAYDLPPERRRPRSFMHAYTFKEREEFYWDPDKWLEDLKKHQPK